MPTYSDACTDCDNRFDAVQAFTDDALTTCPQCTGRLRKLFNSVGVVFKGSGFYRNDSRDSAPKSGSPAAGSSAAEKSGGSEKPSSGDSGSSSSSSNASTSSSSTSASTPSSSAPAASG